MDRVLSIDRPCSKHENTNRQQSELLTAGETQFTRLCMPSTMRIACVGDSLTRGDGAHEGRAQHPTRGNYPATLQHLLPGATVRNFGHGGATACNASDTPYETTREFRHARAFRAHVVVLMLGTNDAKQRHWRGVCKPGVDKLASGFDRILSALQPAAGLVLLPPPVLQEKWGIRRALLQPVHQAIRRWHHHLISRANSTRRLACASTYLAHPLPFWTDTAAIQLSSYVDDGVHLSQMGSQRLACHVRDALRDAGCLDMPDPAARGEYMCGAARGLRTRSVRHPGHRNREYSRAVGAKAVGDMA
jgi:lysophospholipase L1-like esterase